MRNGFVWMGFNSSIRWIKESDLPSYRTEDDVIFHMLNVGDQYIEQGDWNELRLVTVTKIKLNSVTVKRERIIIVKGQ